MPLRNDVQLNLNLHIPGHMVAIHYGNMDDSIARNYRDRGHGQWQPLDLLVLKEFIPLRGDPHFFFKTLAHIK